MAKKSLHQTDQYVLSGSGGVSITLARRRSKECNEIVVLVGRPGCLADEYERPVHIKGTVKEVAAAYKYLAKTLQSICEAAVLKTVPARADFSGFFTDEEGTAHRTDTPGWTKPIATQQKEEEEEINAALSQLSEAGFFGDDEEHSVTVKILQADAEFGELFKALRDMMPELGSDILAKAAQAIVDGKETEVVCIDNDAADKLLEALHEIGATAVKEIGPNDDDDLEETY